MTYDINRLWYDAKPRTRDLEEAELAKDSAIEALAAACAAKEKASDLDAIRAGNSILIRGHAMPAESGTFALVTETGAQIVVARDDVVSVERDGEHFLVEIKSGSDIVARFEQTIKAENSACACSGDESSATRVAVRPAGGAMSNSWCWWELRVVCRLVPIGGTLRIVCFPEPVRVCVPPPIGPPPA